MIFTKLLITLIWCVTGKNFIIKINKKKKTPGISPHRHLFQTEFVVSCLVVLSVVVLFFVFLHFILKQNNSGSQF